LNRFAALATASFAMLALLLGTGILHLPSAEALPPGGTDLFNVTAQVDVKSRLGSETITLTGTAVIAREAPHMDGDVEVAGLQLTELNLTGTSLLGTISVNESASHISSGELRSQQAGSEFPASSYIDAYIVATAPANPFPTILLHNQTALHLFPRQGGNQVPLHAWPPVGVTYAITPIFGVDNDGDTHVDEDTADDDNDGFVDEDRPGVDPDSPGSGFECAQNPDCDDAEGEDPPADLCPPATAGTPSLCDTDGDGLIDEDPSCIPLFNTGNTNLPYGVCLKDVRITVDSFKTPTPGPVETATIPIETPSGTVTPPGPTSTPSPPTATPPHATATAPASVSGDANCSGAVNAVDVAVVLQKIAALIAAVPCPQQADVNSDGGINAVDASLILQFIAHLIAHLPP
jgi:hypothetical protein